MSQCEGTGCLQHHPVCRCSVSWKGRQHSNMHRRAKQWVLQDTFCWCQYEILKRVVEWGRYKTTWPPSFADGGHVGEGTFTINIFLCDVNIAAGGHVVLYSPHSTTPLRISYWHQQNVSCNTHCFAQWCMLLCCHTFHDTLHLHTGRCCIQPVPSPCDICILVLISLWRQHCGWQPCCFIPPHSTECSAVALHWWYHIPLIVSNWRAIITLGQTCQGHYQYSVEFFAEGFHQLACQ